MQKEEDYSKLGRTMWGIVGVGGFGIEHVHPPENKTIITTTRSHSNPVVNTTIAALKPDDVLRVGGSGHKVSQFYFVESIDLQYETCSLCIKLFH